MRRMDDVLEFADPGEFFSLGVVDDMVIEEAMPDSNEDIVEFDPEDMKAQERRAQREESLAVAALGLLEGPPSTLDPAIFNSHLEGTLLGGLDWSWKKIARAGAAVATGGASEVARAAAKSKTLRGAARAVAKSKIARAGAAVATGGASEVARAAIPAAKAAAKQLVGKNPAPLPVTSTTLATTRKALDKTISARRAAVCQAATEKEVHLAKVGNLDKAVGTLAKRLVQAIKEGKQQRAKELTSKVEKFDTLRRLAANRAERFAKLQAVGAVMTTNAQTQRNVLAVAGQVAAKDPAAAQVLVAAARDVERQNKDLKALRQKQIKAWSQKSATESMAVNRLAPPTQMNDLEWAMPSWAKKALPKVGKLLEKAAEKVAPKAVAKIKQAANAAKKLLQKVACPIAKNPAVVQALVGAAAAAVGGPAAAVAAARTAKKLASNSPVASIISKACPAGKQEMTLPSGQKIVVQVAKPVAAKPVARPVAKPVARPVAKPVVISAPALLPVAKPPVVEPKPGVGAAGLAIPAAALLLLL